MPRPRSRGARRDPTKAGKLIRTYEDRLVPLLRNYGRRVAEELVWESQHSMTPGQHHLEAAFHIDPARFFLIMDQILNHKVFDPGWKIIEEEIPKGYERGYTYGALQIGLGAPPDIRRAEAAKIGILVEANKAAFTGIGEETTKQIRRVISDGLVNESRQSEVIKAIMDRSESIGVARAQTMARTEVMNAVNTGVIDQYRRAGVEELEWLTALDERTCQDTFTYMGYTYAGGCEGMDGKVFPIEEAPWCPGHPNCRCTYVTPTPTKGGK